MTKVLSRSILRSAMMKYTISAGASFSLESTGERFEESAEIQITVK